MDERVYWIWLAEALGAGSLFAPMLIRRFGSARGGRHAKPVPGADGAQIPDAGLLQGPPPIGSGAAAVLAAAITAAAKIVFTS